MPNPHDPQIRRDDFDPVHDQGATKRKVAEIEESVDKKSQPEQPQESKSRSEDDDHRP